MKSPRENNGNGLGDQEPILLTVEEVAEALQVGRSMVYGLIQAGSLPAIRLGRLRRIRRSDLREWVEKQK